MDTEDWKKLIAGVLSLAAVTIVTGSVVRWRYHPEQGDTSPRRRVADSLDRAAARELCPVAPAHEAEPESASSEPLSEQAEPVRPPLQALPVAAVPRKVEQLRPGYRRFLLANWRNFSPEHRQRLKRRYGIEP